MSAENDEQGVRFTQVVRGATLSEKVAADITQTIMDGVLRPGEKMPSERELGEQFGVSRTVIREAVRSLVASGLVDAHSGRSLRVAEVGAEGVSKAMGMFLHRSDAIDYARVHQVRAALEIDMAGYAAERATPEDVARLRELTDQLGAVMESDHERAAGLDVAFHQAVAQATGNILFRVLLEAINPVLLDVRRRAFESSELRSYALAAHREILDQIAAGKPDEARAAMRAHLETAERVWDADGRLPAASGG